LALAILRILANSRALGISQDPGESLAKVTVFKITGASNRSAGVAAWVGA
jgi:hypothetical protein